MINHAEAGKFIGEELPELNERFEGSGGKNIYSTVHVLLDYTQEKAESSDLSGVSKCFKMAEKLYVKGDAILKNAIENVYIFSLDNIFCRTYTNKAELLNMIPSALYKAYITQMIGSRI